MENRDILNEERKDVEVNSSNKKIKNPWIMVSIVLGIAVIILLFMVLRGGVTGNVIKGDDAGTKIVDYLNLQTGGGVTYVSNKDIGNLYEVTVSYQGKDIPVYVTKDGKYFVQGAVPLTGNAIDNSITDTQTQTPKEVIKSDKPKVELFIMSYCPYGTQMEKAILPVLSLLGNKIDATIRFTHFTLHGEKEDTENFRQICLREEQQTKFLPYLQCILNSTNPNAPADIDACITKLGIDKAKVTGCITSKAADYYKIDSDLSEAYGVQGSPTLVINGVQVNVGRSPAEILSVACDAFNTKPGECSQTLPTAQASPGFGYSASSADTAAIQCAV